MRPRALLAAALLAGCLGAQEAALVVGTTTTTQDTGLMDALLPAFERDAGVRARAVVGGTGEILEKAKRGDVDVLLSHSPARERALVAEGWATERRPVMHNRFVVAGPASDPAGVRGAPDAAEALRRVRDAGATFASRDDGSGTHEKELDVWRLAGLDPETFGAWYKRTGAGQGQTILYAAERDAYLLVDEGTLRRFQAEGRAGALVALHEGDPLLRNQYGVLPLDPARVPGVRAGEARAFALWLTGPGGQAAIAAHEIDGRPAFTPSAHEAEA